MFQYLFNGPLDQSRKSQNFENSNKKIPEIWSIFCLEVGDIIPPTV